MNSAHGFMCFIPFEQAASISTIKSFLHISSCSVLLPPIVEVQASCDIQILKESLTCEGYSKLF